MTLLVDYYANWNEVFVRPTEYNAYSTTVWVLDDNLEFMEALQNGNRVTDQYQRLRNYIGDRFIHRGEVVTARVMALIPRE